MKKLFCLLAAAALILAGCKEDGPIKVASISVAPASVSIEVGKAHQLVETILPADAANKAVTWESDNPGVAGVSSSGLVTGVAEGQTTIRVITGDGGKTALCTVTVFIPVVPVESVSIEPTLALELGKTATLDATVLPAGATNRTVSWSSDTPAVATVENGEVTGIASGTAKITVTTEDGGKTDDCIVTVFIPVIPVESVSIAPDIALEKGKTAVLTATVTPGNASNKSVVWSSDNPAVATVDEEGKVTAIDSGTAKITVTTEDGEKTDDCIVTVTVKATGVSLDKTAITLKEGDTETLTATVSPADATNKNVSWESSNLAVATVEGGNITALTVGEAVITVTTDDGEKTAECAVTVTRDILVTGVKLEPATLTLDIGKIETLTATISPAAATNKNVSWESNNTAVATVEEGKVTAIASGTAKITVTTEDGGRTAECVVTVNVPNVPVESVRLNKTSMTLTVNGSETLTATVLPADATNQNVSWSSGNSAVARVDAYGVVTALRTGTATITVTTVDGGKKATCTVSVGPYTSSDYSADGRVTRLQQATEGNGINIVMMGDGFSDRLIADGTYEQRMRTATEHFFSEEPYTSFRHLFNIWSVDVVSRNEGFISGGDTALDGWFDGGGSTGVGGDDDKCMSYARRALGAGANLDDVLIVVIMNSTAYAGTCYMYWPEGYPYSTGKDWGNGLAVAYFPIINNNMEQFRQVLVHECGHGFAKLADEYVNYNSTIPSSTVNSSKSMWRYGWHRNVDYTSNEDQIQWAHFIDDNRYTGRVGVYQGADYYAYGAWRPSYNSMMRHNDTHFNAPSREAIYYRIHKLAYGASWQYNYENFVTWDMPNIASGLAIQAAGGDEVEQMKPTSPPVIVNKSWKEALK